MYGTGKGINAYRQTSVTTADPAKLVLMCYEGAISHLMSAKDKYEKKDFEGKGKALQKAHDIISVLLQGLDFDKGGTIAENLNALYNYMSRRLIDGDLKRDLTAFDEVIGMFRELEFAWRQITAPSRYTAEGIENMGGEQMKTASNDDIRNVAGAY